MELAEGKDDGQCLLLYLAVSPLGVSESLGGICNWSFTTIAVPVKENSS